MNRLKYFLLLSILKMKGIKNIFSKSIINYSKLRKEDVYFSKTSFFKNPNIKKITVLNSSITEINQNSDKLIIFIHGGAFISGPAQHHWDTIESIAKKVNQTIWLCNYPKAPEHKINEISENIDSTYNLAKLRFKPENITLIGDSVGATLTITLIQRLVKNNLSLPKRLFLISPVMDCSMSNPDISYLKKKDPMLSIKGVISANNMCLVDGDLKNPMMSPIYGSFKEFPETYLFIAENDITFPDQKIFAAKLKESKVKNKVFIGKKMPHIWPLLPLLNESKLALHEIIKELNANK